MSTGRPQPKKIEKEGLLVRWREGASRSREESQGHFPSLR